jgi:hypothetical protein
MGALVPLGPPGYQYEEGVKGDASASQMWLFLRYRYAYHDPTARTIGRCLCNHSPKDEGFSCVFEHEIYSLDRCFIQVESLSIAQAVRLAMPLAMPLEVSFDKRALRLCWRGSLAGGKSSPGTVSTHMWLSIGRA